jgi:hypothetical protein
MSALQDRAIPLCLTCAAVAAWFASRRLEIWTEDGPGSGLMPKVALGLLAVLGVLVAVRPGPAADESASAGGWNRTFLVYAVAAALMAGAVPALGFVLPALLAVLAILRFAEGRSWLASLGYSLSLIAAIVLLFGTALKVQFPDGPAERVLKSVGVL